MLAPVHRSMPYRHHHPNTDSRESEKLEWWKPRAHEIATYIRDELLHSDLVLLQEWWFRDEFVELFHSITKDTFHYPVSEIRPGLKREDGLAILVNKRGKLDLIQSKRILTGPERIAQLVQCRERCKDGTERMVHVANVHLSFPSDINPIVNERKQAKEVQIVVRALSKTAKKAAERCSSLSRLEIIGGDFNSNSKTLAATKLESCSFYHGGPFVSCASASAGQVLTSGFAGKINLGVTHCTHRGENVSVDHIFTRLIHDQQQPQSLCDYPARNRNNHLHLLKLGYLDASGTQITDCQTRSDLKIQGQSIVSDHRPVTMSLYWPKTKPLSPKREPFVTTHYRQGLFFFNNTFQDNGGVYQPLDPLEPPSWGL